MIKHYDAKTLGGNCVPPPPTDLIASLVAGKGGGISFGPDVCPQQAASVLLALGRIIQLHSSNNQAAIVAEIAEEFGGPEILAHLMSRVSELPKDPTFDQVADIFKPNTTN